MFEIRSFKEAAAGVMAVVKRLSAVFGGLAVILIVGTLLWFGFSDVASDINKMEKIATDFPPTPAALTKTGVILGHPIEIDSDQPIDAVRPPTSDGWRPSTRQRQKQKSGPTRSDDGPTAIV